MKTGKCSGFSPTATCAARSSAARIGELMTPAPLTIGPDELAVEAVAVMEQRRINQLLVTDKTGRLIGALNMHDLFEAKVV